MYLSFVLFESLLALERVLNIPHVKPGTWNFHKWRPCHPSGMGVGNRHVWVGRYVPATQTLALFKTKIWFSYPAWHILPLHAHQWPHNLLRTTLKLHTKCEKKTAIVRRIQTNSKIPSDLATDNCDSTLSLTYPSLAFSLTHQSWSVLHTSISSSRCPSCSKTMNTNVYNVRKFTKSIINKFSSSRVANSLESVIFFWYRSDKGSEQRLTLRECDVQQWIFLRR